MAFVGDALIDDDATYGNLEYFFVTQRPDASIDTRNFAWLLTKSGTNGTAPALPTTNSLAALKQRLEAFRPTIAVIGFGLPTETPAAAEVTNALQRVVTTVAQSAGTNPVRLIVLSPLRREQVAPPLQLAAVNLQISNVVAAVEMFATNRHARFINLFERLNTDGYVPKLPPITGENGHLTEYGDRRMAEYVAYLIGFEPPRWRFGVLLDGRLREGGFGVSVLETNKTPERARIAIRLANVPLPAVSSNLALAYFMTPENRVQVVGMSTGRYDFKIDGKIIANPTEQDLTRSIAVKSGPQYEIAAQLRDAIVKRQRLLREQDHQSELTKPEDAARVKAEIAALKQQIAAWRVPGTNVIEIVPGVPPAGVSP